MHIYSYFKELDSYTYAIVLSPIFPLALSLEHLSMSFNINRKRNIYEDLRLLPCADNTLFNGYSVVICLGVLL